MTHSPLLPAAKACSPECSGCLMGNSWQRCVCPQGSVKAGALQGGPARGSRGRMGSPGPPWTSMGRWPHPCCHTRPCPAKKLQGPAAHPPHAHALCISRHAPRHQITYTPPDGSWGSGVCFVFLAPRTQAEQARTPKTQTQQPRELLPRQTAAQSTGHKQASPHAPVGTQPQARECPHRSGDAPTSAPGTLTHMQSPRP